MKQSIFAIILASVSTSAFAFTPEIEQKMEILLSVVKSPKTSIEAKQDLDALVGPNKQTIVRVQEFDCLNTKSTDFDYNFSCDIGYSFVPVSGGEKETSFELLVDGHVDKGVRTIDGVQRKMGQ